MSGRLSPGMAELKRLYNASTTDERRRAIGILAYVKGCWYRQPIDGPIVDVWVDVLWDIDLEDGRAAAKQYFETDSPSPPTPFQIRSLALAKRELRLAKHKRLEAPRPTPEERAAGLKVLREAIKKATK